MSQYLTVNELCEKFKVTRTTITNWRNEGMPHEKFGKLVRFNEQEVLIWLKNKNNSKEN